MNRPGEDTATKPWRVLPPGQEKVISEMLGQDEELPGGCRWDSATIDHDHVVASYQCSGLQLQVTLFHPEAAPPGAQRLGQVAMTVPESAPPGFAGALAGRVLNHQGGLTWVVRQPVPRAYGSSHSPLGTGRNDLTAPTFWSRISGGSSTSLLVAGTAVLVALAAALAVAAARRRRGGRGHAAERRQPFPALARLSGGRRFAAAALAALVACGSGHGFLLAVGAMLAAPLNRHAPWRIGLAALAAMTCLMVVGIAQAALRQLAPGRATRWTAAMAALYLAAAFPASLRHDEAPRFGRLRLPIGGVYEETYARRPRITYRVGPLGFREPAFAVRKADGILRIALIGDSFVFGSGVTSDGTLSSQLAAQLQRSHPGRPIEALNLGVPGHNLTSHVDLYAAAVDRLAPDVVVLCLTLPNDLGSWDLQDELRDSARPSLYSTGRFLLGSSGAQVLWDMALLRDRVTPEGLAHLRSELARLSELRARGGPPLLVLTFQIPEPAITAELVKLTAVPLVLCPGDHPDDFIPGDGHPTASGNARSAAMLAHQLAESGLVAGDAPPLPAAR